ncbi:hypothetical protein ER57_13540 [Smithella sp. SCADC]|nr:hypothetical protein ER57_13540 [Smithella sp. SCADC]
MQWHFLFCDTVFCTRNDRGNYHPPSIPPLEGGKFKRRTGFTLKGTSPDQVGNDRGNYHPPSIPPLEGGKFKRRTGFTLKGTSPDQVGNDKGSYHPPSIPPLEGGKIDVGWILMELNYFSE